MDGDGLDDVVTANWSNSFSVFRATGDGTLSEADVYGVAGLGWGQRFALGDFDGDGDVDVTHPVPFHGVSFLPNQSAP